MKHSFFDFDNKLLKQDGIFKRFSSVTATAIKLENIKVDPNLPRMIKEFENEIRGNFMPRYRTKTITYNEIGQLINVDAAFDGIPECYLHMREVKPIFKIGLNCSSVIEIPDDVLALRAAATIAVSNIAKMQGRAVQYDICYGCDIDPTHVRITVQQATSELIARISTQQFKLNLIGVILNQVNPKSTVEKSGYQFKRMYSRKPILKQEFDFALDRVVESDAKTYKQAILQEIKISLGLIKNNN